MKYQKNENKTRNLVQEATDIIKLFEQKDPKPWPLETKALDLTSHVGLINQAVLEKKGYKEKGSASGLLGTELATVFFIILDIAQSSGIEFEEAFFDFLSETQKNLT